MTTVDLEDRVIALEQFAALVVDTMAQMTSDSELATDDRRYLEARIREMEAVLSQRLPDGDDVDVVIRRKVTSGK